MPDPKTPSPLELLRDQLSMPGGREVLQQAMAAAADVETCTQGENFLASWLDVAIKAFDELERQRSPHGDRPLAVCSDSITGANDVVYGCTLDAGHGGQHRCVCCGTTWWGKPAAKVADATAGAIDASTVKLSAEHKAALRRMHAAGSLVFSDELEADRKQLDGLLDLGEPADGR
jgi:hypothetical protein